MDERGANIDLLFRNGLKDYEVLPPAEAWDNIRPVVKRSNAYIVYRYAAAAAVLTVISLLAITTERRFPQTALPSASLMIEMPDPVRTGTTPEVLLPATDSRISSTAFTENVNLVYQASYTPGIIPVVPELSATELAADYSPVLSLSGNKAAYSAPSATAYPEITLPETEVPAFFPELKQQLRERWSITALISPTYYSGISGGGELAQQLMETENPVMSYAGGFSVSYKVNRRFSVQTGLYYASQGQEVTGINAFGGLRKYYFSKGDNNFQFLTSSGMVFTDNADVYLSAEGKDRIQTSVTSNVFDPDNVSLQYLGNSVIQNFSYIQMPVVIRYKMIDRTLDVNLLGGVSYDLLVGNSVYTRSDNGRYRIGRTEGLNPFCLSSSLGLGMEYEFSKKLSLNLEPTFRYFINPFSGSSSTGIHPYSFGVFSGFSYRF